MNALLSVGTVLAVCFWPAAAMALLAWWAEWGYFGDDGDEEVGRLPGWAAVAVTLGGLGALIAAMILLPFFVGF